MAKRHAANGSGSIRQRPDGRWEGRYSAGFNPGTGKQIQRSVYGKTQKEVRQKLNQITVEIDNGSYTKPLKLTLGAWLQIAVGCILFRNDDIQHFVLMIYNSCGIDDIHGVRRDLCKSSNSYAKTAKISFS